MTHINLFSFLKKSVFALTLIVAAAAIAAPAIPVKASGFDGQVVLAYAEEEGMGTITSYVNEIAFKDSSSVKSGDVVRVHAEYYPRCSFEGWYLNGTLKTTNLNYSFTIGDEPMYIISASYRENGDTHYHNMHAHVGISQTNWANRTCKFANGSGKYDVAVTTQMAVQGEKCLEAFEAMAGDYKLARTYNISFTRLNGSQTIDSLEAPADFLFQIPKELQMPGRSFRMINVYKGQPTVLEDQDASDETITFTTDRSGAFALVYLDPSPVSVNDPDEEIDPLMSYDPEAEAAAPAAALIVNPEIN